MDLKHYKTLSKIFKNVLKIFINLLYVMANAGIKRFAHNS